MSEINGVEILPDGSVTFESLMLVVGLAFLIPILLYKLKLRVLPVVLPKLSLVSLLVKTGIDRRKQWSGWTFYPCWGLST